MVGGDFLSRPRPYMGCSAWECVSEQHKTNWPNECILSAHFIYGLLNDPISSSNYMVLKDRKLAHNDSEGPQKGASTTYVKALSQHLTQQTETNQKNPPTWANLHSLPSRRQPAIWLHFTQHVWGLFCTPYSIRNNMSYHLFQIQKLCKAIVKRLASWWNTAEKRLVGMSAGFIARRTGRRDFLLWWLLWVMPPGGKAVRFHKPKTTFWFIFIQESSIATFLRVGVLIFEWLPMTQRADRLP